MAEIKNSFLKAKMNQDVDDRLIPNGEYREALNISVGKSESSDVGTLQNIFGNIRVDAKNRIVGAECIGYFMDNVNNCIYQFITNEGDNQTDPITHQITVYNFTTNIKTVLVEGDFLNFLKSKPITAVTLVENLLFWTDYNNQPRKINVNLANPNALTVPTYYTTEEQISVAKYAPIEPVSLVRKAVTTATAIVSGSSVIPVASTTGIVIGMTVVSGTNINGLDYVLVESIGVGSVTVSKNVSLAINEKLTFLISTMSDKSSDPLWPGDPAFLKSKYVRFSYRFKLDDGEYTLMAPFTQIAYIPNQKGYFLEGNENEAYTSTVLKWFENNVNNIKLLIPFPDVLSKVNQSYKIQALDILYKESDGAAIHVVETIPYGAFSINTVNNIYEYDYQSRKPYKTLPEDQTTRVYDMVPVKAKAQESAGNRIIYGNFLKNHTAPESLDYQVSVTKKQDTSTSFVEYPNHTLKQNRTYQVGFILADKFGRQSSVILSSLDTIKSTVDGVSYGGSTIFSPYYSSADLALGFVKNWFGNALTVLVNSPISSTKAPTGEPGLYAEPTSSSGFTLTGTTTITDSTYTFTISGSSGAAPIVGEYLRGEYTDYVKITQRTGSNPYTVTTSGRVNSSYLRDAQSDPKDIKYAYSINALGWYSYKLVVRQQEQEYYNVYLPGMLNGYPAGQTYGSQVVYSGGGTPSNANGINTTIFPTNENNRVAHTVLINDNINKIPRDLVEVGPDQKLYRSSVQLYGRVENTITVTGAITSFPNNKQYFPSQKADTAIAISTSTDLGFLPKTVDNDLGSAVYNFYQLETQPSIARISTTNSIGVLAYPNISTFGPPPSGGASIQDPPDVKNMAPYLSVYETKPVYSLLDVFWETSTTGLISDLNADVLTGYDGAVDLSDILWTFTEASDPNNIAASKYITNAFWPESNTGIPINSSGAVLTVNDANNIPVNYFGLESTIVNPGPSQYLSYRIYLLPGSDFVFIRDISLTTFFFSITLLTGNNIAPTTYVKSQQLKNVTPTITTPATLTFPVELGSTIPSSDPIFVCKAKNGATLPSLQVQELVWDIIDSGSTAGWGAYFSVQSAAGGEAIGVNPGDGLIYLNAILPLVPPVWNLNVRVRDAVTAAGPLLGPTGYSTEQDTCVLEVSLASIPICGREWTATNFSGITYADNTPIPGPITNAADWAAQTAGAWCYPNFNPANEAQFGKIYNGYAIQGIFNPLDTTQRKQFAPNGFRIPYAAELGLTFGSPCALGCVTGNDLKLIVPSTNWVVGATGNNSSGFNGVGSGWINGTTGIPTNFKEYAGFHARQGLNGNGYAAWGLYYNTNSLAAPGTPSATTGYSVRFIDNNIDSMIATKPPLSPSCTFTYVDLNGNSVTVTLDENNPGPFPFDTISSCTVTGTCTIT
jgi:hypothetical protein